MRIVSALLVFLLVSPSTVAAVPVNEPPLADAGLDQTVRKHARVYLDATGSRDPDGRVASYRWTIDSPDGGVVHAACDACGRTSFVAAQVGTYTATIRLTDEDGATATDTLYVRVEPGDPPQVAVEGPTAATVGDPARYRAVASAGDAPLRRIVWRVDGEVVRTVDVDGAAATDPLTYVFDDPGDHGVTASVVDADDRRAARSVRVRVRSPTPAPALGTGSPAAPVVRGPRLVTGARPLVGTYAVDGAAGDVRWLRDGAVVGGGPTAAVTLAPGVHDLSASVRVPGAGRTVARFADGTTTVVADPRPGVRIENLTTAGSISVATSATDGFGNLVSLSVSVDGERVAERSLSPVEFRRAGGYERLSLRTGQMDVSGGRHTVVVRARDSRGQVAMVRRQVGVVGPPEVVSAEFVNDPVDSYDRRIDPGRYVAHHVLKVDLNGMNRSAVSVASVPDSPAVLHVEHSQFERRTAYNDANDVLTIHSYWARDYPSEGGITQEITWRTGSKFSQSTFDVNYSDPELRLHVRFTGVTNRPTSWGMIVDAGDSFDPDNSRLKYEWYRGATPLRGSETVAKFDAFHRAGIRVIDGEGNVSNETEEFLAYYVPKIEEVSVVSKGPYQPGERVTFHVKTEFAMLTKNRFARYLEDRIQLRSTIGGAAVEDWEQVRDVIVNDPRVNSSYADVHDLYYRGNITFRASDLLRSSEETVTVFNDEHPQWVKNTAPLPNVWVLQPSKSNVTNVEVVNASYLVERPTFEYRTTPYSGIRDALVADGYDVVKAERTGTEYVVERRVKTEPAAYRTYEQRFLQPWQRRFFLLSHPDWSPTGTETTTRTWTNQVQEWRDSRSGSGKFTGRTRRVLVDDADYRVQKKFSYETEVRETNYEWETRYRRVRVRHSRTHTVEKCNRYVGCYESTVTDYYWTTETESYQVRESYTTWETVTKTYWAYGPVLPSHTYTGDSRRIEVDEARYETQYEYVYKAHHSSSRTWYVAEQRVLVSPAQYEWQAVRTTRSELDVRQVRWAPDARIGDSRSVTEWTLARKSGTYQTWDTNVNGSEKTLKTVAWVNKTTKIPMRNTGNNSRSSILRYDVIKREFERYLSGKEIVTTTIEL